MSSARFDYKAISEHYDQPDLEKRILQALLDSGADLDALRAEDLAPIDQFHSRGKSATLELAHRARIAEGMEVLDVGGGIGGAARALASTFGCRVVVLDLTESYCRVGTALTARVDLDDKVRFEQGNALEMSFADRRFDLVWLQHATMNIADKDRLFAEVSRVLRPGGRLALHEITAGPVEPIHLPVPWARMAGLSHLLSPSAMHRAILGAGFVNLDWVDETTAVTRWFRDRVAAIRNGPMPALGLHLLLGQSFGAMFSNQLRNLAENRIRVVQGVFTRP